MHSFRKVYKLIFLFIFFNTVLSCYRLFPVYGSYNRMHFLIPLGELFLVMLFLLPGKIYRLRKFLSLSIISFLLFYNIAEIFYRFFYLERFNMFTDYKLIPGMFIMIIPSGFVSPEIITVLTVVFSFSVLYILSSVVIVPLKKQMINISFSSPLKYFIFIAAAFVFMFISPENSPLIKIVTDILPVNKMVSELPANGVSKIYENEVNSGLALYDEVLEPEDNWKFPGIKDSNIHLVVVESYGAVLFQRPEYTNYIYDLYRKLESLLTKDGWAIRSGFVRSPAFGGRSWLADASLLTAVQINDQKLFDDIIKEGDPAYFLKLMGDSGYHRTYVAPGTTKASDEWKAAYPFDKYLLRQDFGYEGPNIAFGTLTDQYALNTFSRNYLIEDENYFAYYLLVSSHTPFERIPVYKPDWDFSLKGKEYESGYLKIFKNNWLSGKELAEGYLESISYSLETTIMYLTERLTANEFMIIIGDHQPRKPVSGPDPGYPVPFHIIAPENLSFNISDSWKLSETLSPPKLPNDYNEIPEMADIPLLIEDIIKGSDKERYIVFE